MKHLTRILLFAAAFASCSGFFNVPEIKIPTPIKIPSVPDIIDAVSGGSTSDSGSSLAVVGGDDTGKPVPYMASLRGPDGRHRCGGSLIHPKVVLTAAHCVDDGVHPDVHIGRYNREGGDYESRFDTHRTDTVILHEEYSNSRGYDIALLILDSASSRDPISFAESDKCFEDQAGCSVRILGWGTTSYRGPKADVLQEAYTTSVSRNDCERLLGQDRIMQTMICAGEIEGGGIDTCQGDSGGPLLQDGKQVGITSWGDGCANSQSPGVYESVPELRPWINFKLMLIDFQLPLDSDPCECAKDGISNGVATHRSGCKQHLAEHGDSDVFCMTVGGMACSRAQPSKPFRGAAWVLCDAPTLGDINPCTCATDGVSNGVSTGRSGCKQHLVAHGDYDIFCMTVGGMACSSAQPSVSYPGAAWVLCS